MIIFEKVIFFSVIAYFIYQLYLSYKEKIVHKKNHRTRCWYYNTA